MNVGIDAHLVLRHPTGVGKSIIRTVEEMARLSPDDKFIIYANKKYPKLELPNCRVIRTPLIHKFRLMRIFHEIFAMPRNAWRDKLNVFWAPGYVYPGALLTPLVLGVPDLNALKYPDMVLRRTAHYYKLMIPSTAKKRCDRVIVPTRAVADDFEKIVEYPREKISVVPLGCDDIFKKGAENTTNVLKRHKITRPYVLYVGNIEPNKNLERLVQAFFAAKLNRQLRHTLVIVGKERFRAREVGSRAFRLGIANSTLFTGYVPDADLPAIYSGADVFVYPSIAEGFGLPPVEAMACGTPVITSTDPALVEVAGDAALHVPAEDTPALREALENVISDRMLAERLRKAGREMAAKYSWTETARKTLEVLREVAR